MDARPKIAVLTSGGAHALVDGTSPITRRRVQMMERIEGVLGL